MVIYMYLCKYYVESFTFIIDKIGHPVLFTRKFFLFILLYDMSFVKYYKSNSYYIKCDLLDNYSGKMVAEV